MEPASCRFSVLWAVVAASLSLLAPHAPAQQVARVDPIPEGPDAVVEALSPFHGAPDSSRVAKILDQQRAAGFPSTDYDRVLVARLWRRAGETEFAAEALADIPTGSDAFDLAVYEAVRVWLTAGREAAGARAYWRACGLSDPRVRAEVHWDLLPLMTPDERTAWNEMEPGTPTCEFLRGIFDERAQGMAVTRDRRLAIHFQRLDRARREMRLRAPRWYIEPTDHHGRPPGLAIDDRGLMLVRMGEPEVREICPLEGDLLAECWGYYRPAGYRLMRFSQYKKARGEVIPDGDYTLDEGVPIRGPGDAWNLKYVRNADIPASALAEISRSWRASVIAGGAVRDSAEQAMDAVQYNARAYRPLVLATRRYADAALREIPDVPDVKSTVSLRFEALRFLNPSSGRWQVWLLTSVKAGDLSPSSDADDATRSVGGHFAAGQPTGPDVMPFPTHTVPASTADEAGIELRGATAAEPGPLPVTVVVEDENRPGAGGWVQDTVQIPRVGGLPQLSDIAIARATGGTWTRDGETYLQVTPAHITNPDGSILTYFEVYGIDPGTRYDVEFRMVREGDAERIWRIEPGDLAFRLQFSSQMMGDIGRHHLRLDLSGTEPGEYVLGVRIQDERSKAYSLPSVTNVFVRGR